MNKRWKNAIKGTAYLVAAVSIVGIAGVQGDQNQEPARDNDLMCAPSVENGQMACTRFG